MPADSSPELEEPRSGEDGGLKAGEVVKRPEVGDRVTSSSLGESGVLERERVRIRCTGRESASGVGAGREFADTAVRERVFRRGPEPGEVFRGGSREPESRMGFLFGIPLSCRKSKY